MSHPTPSPEELKTAFQLGVMSASLDGLSRDVSHIGQRLDKIELPEETIRRLLKAEVGDVLDNHELRIASLEKWRWGIGGGAALLIFLVSIFFQWKGM